MMLDHYEKATLTISKAVTGAIISKEENHCIIIEYFPYEFCFMLIISPTEILGGGDQMGGKHLWFLKIAFW